MSLSIEQSCACVDVMEDFIQKKFTFTAYDVTKTLRQNGFWVEHPDVKDCVHAYMDEIVNVSGNYTKELQDVVPGTKAFVYAPEEEEIEADKTDDDEQNITPDGNDWLTVQRIVKADARGRLCIPASIIRSAGMQAGSVAILMKDQDQISIVKGDANNIVSCLAWYFVDKDDNIRITASVLNSVLDYSSEYGVYYDVLSNVIVVDNL